MACTNQWRWTAGAIAVVAGCVATLRAIPPAAARPSAVSVLSCCSASVDQSAAQPADEPRASGPASASSAPEGRGRSAPAAAPAPDAQQQSAPSIRGTVSVSGRSDLQKADLTRIVVYLASDPQLDAAPSDICSATIAQKNKSFVPSMAAIARGTTVEFPNWDDFDHNVFSRSAAAPAFDLDRYPRGQSKARVFEKVGVVQVFCNIHPQMRAIIVVTPNKYFTRADAAGRFELAGVPPGRYQLVAWQERCGEQRQAVQVTAGEVAQVSLALAENRQSILANDPPRRDSGYGVERGLGVRREKLNLPVVTESHPAPAAPPD